MKPADGLRDLAEREACLVAYDLEFLRDAYDEGAPHELTPFAEAVEEFRRFCLMALRQDQALAVLHRSADHLWHCFIVQTAEYETFCQTVFGGFLHHRRNSDRTPVPVTAVANTIDCYRRWFGELSDRWLIDEHVRRHAANGEALPERLSTRWSGWPGR